MTNLEKYKDQLMSTDFSVDSKGNINLCQNADCEECIFYKDEYLYDCARAQMEWLKAEYIKPEVDWSKVPIDTKVLVSGDGKKWYPRYYAGLNDGDEPTAWIDGKTSWTKSMLEYNKSRYPLMKLAEEEGEC